MSLAFADFDLEWLEVPAEHSRSLTVPFSRIDMEIAADEWGASCGPGALATVAGVHIETVRRVIPNFRGWMNPTHMLAAAKAMGITARELSRPTFRNEPSDGGPDVSCCTFEFPTNGLMFIQFGGPWMNAPVTVQYRYTHWIGCRIIGAPNVPVPTDLAPRSEKQAYADKVTAHWWVFDANAGWQLWQEWVATTFRELVVATPKADGQFWPRQSWEFVR